MADTGRAVGGVDAGAEAELSPWRRVAGRGEARKHALFGRESATHYLVHFVYALGQAPLLAVMWRAARGARSEPASA